MEAQVPQPCTKGQYLFKDAQAVCTITTVLVSLNLQTGVSDHDPVTSEGNHQVEINQNFSQLSNQH